VVAVDLPAGVALAVGFGALTGAVVGSEAAEHWYQLYKMDKQGANLRFIYWWEDKVAGLSVPFSAFTPPSFSYHDTVSTGFLFMLTACFFYLFCAMSDYDFLKLPNETRTSQALDSSTSS
jgi:hypothetical protein